MTRLFVYGTLKRGGTNHRKMAGQVFVGTARTVAGYRLFLAGPDPAMVPVPADTSGVSGEVWDVDERCLAELDRFEGVNEGLYRRVGVPLAPPFAGQAIDGYLHARPIEGCADIGSEWPV